MTDSYWNRKVRTSWLKSGSPSQSFTPQAVTGCPGCSWTVSQLHFPLLPTASTPTAFTCTPPPHATSYPLAVHTSLPGNPGTFLEPLLWPPRLSSHWHSRCCWDMIVLFSITRTSSPDRLHQGRWSKETCSAAGQRVATCLAKSFRQAQGRSVYLTVDHRCSVLPRVKSLRIFWLDVIFHFCEVLWALEVKSPWIYQETSKFWQLRLRIYG